MGSFKCEHYKQLIVTTFITLSGYRCLLSLLLKTKIVKTAIWKQLRSLYDKPTNQSVFLHYFTQLVPWGCGRLSFRLRIDLTISLGWTPNGSIFLNLESILKYKLPIEKEKIYLLACCVNFSYNIYGSKWKQGVVDEFSISKSKFNFIGLARLLGMIMQ